MNPELFFGQTDTGKQRDNNEDAFIAENVSKDKYIAACVIDGVGGYEGGEVAAAIAKETILDTLKSASGDPLELMKSSLPPVFLTSTTGVSFISSTTSCGSFFRWSFFFTRTGLVAFCLTGFLLF